MASGLGFAEEPYGALFAKFESYRHLQGNAIEGKGELPENCENEIAPFFGDARKLWSRDCDDEVFPVYAEGLRRLYPCLERSSINPTFILLALRAEHLDNPQE